MTTRSPRGVALSLLLGLAAWAMPGRAGAQWGYGFWGYQPYIGQDVAQRQADRSLQAGQAAYAARAGGGGGGLSDPYYLHVRDPGFQGRYGISTRQTIESRSLADRPAPAPAPASTPAPATGPPDLPIASFFNRYGELVWPGDAPALGDLAEKRKRADAACAEVLKETRARGAPSVAATSEARTQLLAYGRPALALLRSESTPRVADSFHLFLQSLYYALGQAANPRPASPPRR